MEVQEKIFKILLVEDEPKLQEVIKQELERKGYATDTASNAIDAENLFNKNNYSLIILDVNIPYKSGLTLCKEFRNLDKKIPIIMLTAIGEIHDKMIAFGYGADDYIVKPFYFDELFARVNVFIKRAEKQIDSFGEIRIADLVINYENRKVTRGTQEIILTAKEFSLLNLLCRNKNEVVTKKEILESVWNMSFDTGTNTIEVYISFLRNKIDKSFEQKLIYTKAGFGYYIKE